MIRIAIVEDHEMFRQGLKYSLETNNDFRVVAEATCGAEFEKCYNPNEVDIVLLDLRLKGQSGVLTCQNLMKKHPNVKIAILSSYDDPELILHMIRVGASAYISKTCGLEKIALVIRQVISNGFFYDSDIGAMLRNEMAKAHKKFLNGEVFSVEFSDIELQIVIHHCNQLSNKEIAEKLNMGMRTIEWHKKAMVEKTYSHNFTGVIVYMFRHYLIFPDTLNADVALKN